MGLSDEPVEAALFDLDGTLVLSEGRNAEVWQRFLGRRGVDPTPSRLRQVTGRRAVDSLAELARELPDRLHGSVPDLLVELVAVEDATPLGQVREVPGAAALVRRTAACGVRVAVVTSASRPYALSCLEEIGVRDVVEVLVTAEDVDRGKPDPQGYLRAAEELGVAPARALGYEDSVAGIAALRAAGARCVGVATGGAPEALAAADVVVDDLTDPAAAAHLALCGERS